MPSDPRGAFIAHSNYLLAFDLLIRANDSGGNPFFARPHQVLTSIVDAVRASSSFGSLRPQASGVAFPALRSALRNAWGTELLLLSTERSAEDDLIGVANNWAVVQAYYACYHFVQALAVARRQPTPTTHAKLRQHYSMAWVTQSVLSPWSLGWQSNSCKNLPAERDVQPVHVWSTCDADSSWDFAAQALRTTREEQLKDRASEERQRRKTSKRKQWEQEEQARVAGGSRPRKRPRFPRPNLSRTDRESLDAGFRPTTLLDYLYRLRLRSNYEDSTMFTDGPETPSESRQVHGSLCRITSATAFIHELYIPGTHWPYALRGSSRRLGHGLWRVRTDIGIGD